jgi:hypothetical protein
MREWGMQLSSQAARCIAMSASWLGKVAVLAGVMLGVASGKSAPAQAEWQWSVPVENGFAFLWIPPGCERVRAVMFGQHNMLEEGIMEHPVMREELAKQGIAEVWVAPRFDTVFRFDQGAGEKFDALMRTLATTSGYDELATRPVVPIGHSACASFPWNFAAWNPERTLAVLSIHGDAPQTNLTGSGMPNPDWGNRRIDGVPGLFVIGEYEWMEQRIAPGLAFRKKFPKAPVAFLAEPGRGHFDASDELVAYLAKFIRKAVEARLPSNGEAPLRLVDPSAGWLVPAWRLNQPHRPPVPAANFAGDPSEAFWTFDEEMARATTTHYAEQVGKKPQLLGFEQEGRVVPQVDVHEQVRLKFLPENEALHFRLKGTFLDRVEDVSKNLSRWTGLPAGSPLGHAAEGEIRIRRITGPVRELGDGLFELALNRTWSTTDKRNPDLWFYAEHPGDGDYKSAVQQAMMRLEPNKQGKEQRIDFPPIADQPVGVKSLKLAAVSDADLPVKYYVREGPAVVDGDTLRFTELPPRSRFPVRVTVIAWQWGRGGESPVKTAQTVERTFLIVK